MFCRNCGNELPDGAKFCGKCGTQVGQAKADGSSQSASYSSQQNRADYGDKSGAKKIAPIIIAIIAAVTVVVIVAMVSLFGKGDSAISDEHMEIQESEEIESNEDNTPADNMTAATDDEETEESPTNIDNTVAIGDVVTFGSYEQDNNTSNGKEDIEWIVLDKEDGKALLISKYILDCRAYNEAEEHKDITWEECTLRQWLNQDFLNEAVTEAEKNDIVLSEIENNDNREWEVEGGEDTDDQIFLLSIDEAKQYFNSDDARITTMTDYAKKRMVDGEVDSWMRYGAVEHSEEELREEYEGYVKEYAGRWNQWLRSPGYVGSNVAIIRRDGSVYGDGDFAREDIDGVRPALWINLE